MSVLICNTVKSHFPFLTQLTTTPSFRTTLLCLTHFSNLLSVIFISSSHLLNYVYDRLFFCILCNFGTKSVKIASQIALALFCFWECKLDLHFLVKKMYSPFTKKWCDNALLICYFYCLCDIISGIGASGFFLLCVVNGNTEGKYVNSQKRMWWCDDKQLVVWWKYGLSI